MKKIILIAFLFINGMIVAQSNYENGIVYYSNGTQLNCKIASKNWYKNPESFKYQSEDKKLIEIQVNSIDSLKIEDHTKFIRIKYNNSDILLKEIVGSKQASLYALISSNARKYFYKKNDEDYKELVYEELINNDGTKRINYGYIFQLNSEFKTGDELISNKKLKYNEKDLKEHFINYNNYSNNTIQHLDKSKPINYYLGGLIGYSMINSSMENNNALPRFHNNTDYKFENSSALKAGLSFEINLPYNNYNWSILNEVLYTKFSLEGKHFIQEANGLASEINYLYSANYNTVEYLLGIRYNYNLNKNSKIIVDALFNLLTIESGKNNFKVVEDLDNTTYNLDVDYSSKIVFGIGYKYRDYTLGFRFSTPKNFINGNEYYSQKNQESYVFFRYDFKLNK
jgi:hypothetical protein